MLARREAEQTTRPPRLLATHNANCTASWHSLHLQLLKLHKGGSIACHHHLEQSIDRLMSYLLDIAPKKSSCSG